MQKDEVHVGQEEVLKEQLAEVQEISNKIVNFMFPSVTDFESERRERAEKEARLESLTLDRDGLTPGMRDLCLIPAQKALEDFNKLLHAFQSKISPYRERMAALSNHNKKIAELQQKTALAEQLAEKKVGADHNYHEAKEKFEKSRELYDIMFMKKGQIHAKDFPIWLYIPLLIGIGIVEWAINYMAVLEQYGTPILAMGLTAAVGGSVALASHAHGTFLKQLEYYFGPSVERQPKIKQFSMVIAAALLLILSLVFVAWTRYLWAAAELARATKGTIIIVPGAAQPIINIGQQVTITMVANILVYLIGMAIAFWVHDPDPDYTTRKRVLRKAKKVWDKWQDKVTEEKKVIQAQMAKEIKEEENLATAFNKRYKPLNDEKEKVNEKHRSIIQDANTFLNKLLEGYKYLFVANARTYNQRIKLINSEGLITIDSYADLRLGLDYFSDNTG